jgi:hypothetical protein
MPHMNNTQKLQFNKKINIDFSWWEITWNAWLLSMHEFCNKLSVLELIKKYLPENRWLGYEHTKPEIIYQEMIRIINWDTSNNNYKYHKKDPVFLEIHNQKIASASTCSRLDNTFNYSDESNLRKVIKDIERYNIEQSKTKEVIIDLDTTNDPCSENLEWADYIPHYWLNWYSPLFAFNGLNWDLISWILKPWRYHCSTFSHSFTKNIIDFYKENWVKNIILRWDSAFPNDNMLWLCELEEVHYFFKLKWYSSLIKMVSWKWVRWKSTFIELEYQATSWSNKRRVVCCIDWKARETEESKKARKKNPKKKKIKQMWLFPIYSFVVTNNMKLYSEEVFSMYNWRATIEKSIEEAKNGFESDHLSNSNFKINATKFQIHLLAIQLTQLFRKFSLAKESKQTKKNANDKFVDSKNKNKKFKKLKVWRKQIKLPSVSTLRKQIFSIPAKIVKTWRKIFYKCASSFPYQEKVMKIFDVIQSLVKLKVE